MTRKTFLVTLIAAVSAASLLLPSTPGAAADDGTDRIGGMLDEARREFFEAAAGEAANLEVVEVDRSSIIHVPQSYTEPQPPSPIEPSADRPVTYAGPFNPGDTRDFYADASVSGGYIQTSLIKGVLMGQGEHVNIWVLDCADYHAKTATTHTADCRLPDIDNEAAQRIAGDCDEIYERMTADFGAHANVIMRPGYSNCPEVGDLGGDGKVNFLFYDIHGDGGPPAGYVAGFFGSYDFFTDQGSNTLDILHIDIGNNQGYTGYAPGASEAEKLTAYGTLAHELQHLLFYMYFGLYVNWQDSSYNWFNEALSELAGTYYVSEGVEVADFSRLSGAAPNSYANGSGYGDFLSFNNSFKNYSMGKLFSMLFYKTYGSGFTQGIYGEMEAELPPAQNYSQLSANMGKVENAGHDAMAGSLLYAAANLGETPADAFPLAYFLFMESFAADGGMIYGAGGGAASAKFYTAANPVDNLWAIRAVGGASNGVVFSLPDAGGGGYLVNDSSYLIPAYTSGSAITLSGYGTSGAKPASHEMLYKLSGGGAALPYLRITAPDDGSGATRYYALIRNDPTVTGGGYTYCNGTNGADVYPLRKGIEEVIDTGGMPAYLFVTTLRRNVSSAVTYSWDDEPPYTEPFTGLYGDANGDGRVNGTDVQALILWINSGKTTGDIDTQAANVTGMPGAGAALVDVSDVQAIVVWINKGGKAAEGMPPP